MHNNYALKDIFTNTCIVKNANLRCFFIAVTAYSGGGGAAEGGHLQGGIKRFWIRYHFYVNPDPWIRVIGHLQGGIKGFWIRSGLDSTSDAEKR